MWTGRIVRAGFREQVFNIAQYMLLCTHVILFLALVDKAAISPSDLMRFFLGQMFSLYLPHFRFRLPMLAFI